MDVIDPSGNVERRHFVSWLTKSTEPIPQRNAHPLFSKTGSCSSHSTSQGFTMEKPAEVPAKLKIISRTYRGWDGVGWYGSMASTYLGFQIWFSQDFPSHLPGFPYMDKPYSSLVSSDTAKGHMSGILEWGPVHKPPLLWSGFCDPKSKSQKQSPITLKALYGRFTI